MSITITSGMIFVAGYLLAKCAPTMISSARDKMKEMKDKNNKSNNSHKN